MTQIETDERRLVKKKSVKIVRGQSTLRSTRVISVPIFVRISERSLVSPVLK